jgi:hypothetical protein
VLAALLLTLFPPGEASARWRCEPAAVEVGEPFELRLELEHPADVPGGTLVAGEPALDDSWLVLEREPARPSPAGAPGEKTVRTVLAWRVVSLEPGERSLADALSAVALSGAVTRIQVGEARVEVRGVLGEGEDAPRPMREFPEGFAGESTAASGTSAWWAWAGGVLVVATGAGAVLWRRALRARAAGARAATPLDRLGELEGWIETERARASCYELTRLLREATDRARSADRAGLTDDEWLAELQASRALPGGAVQELAAVLERAARVKYAGEAPSSWALKETFARARVALQAVGAGGGA